MNIFFYFFCGFISIIIYGFSFRKEKDYRMTIDTFFSLFIFGVFSLLFSIIIFAIYYTNELNKINEIYKKSLEIDNKQNNSQIPNFKFIQN